MTLSCSFNTGTTTDSAMSGSPSAGGSKSGAPDALRSAALAIRAVCVRSRSRRVSSGVETTKLRLWCHHGGRHARCVASSRSWTKILHFGWLGRRTESWSDRERRLKRPTL